ncbi:MAG: dihydroorotase [Prevotella sp.]|nr:dihydroorotase [Candidatus Prevotella equi]
MKTLIKNGIVVNEGKRQRADIVISNDCIERITPEGISANGTDSFDTIIDAQDCIVMPGVIDTHVHFREPGLTHKADMDTESRAAAYGGVTSVFEMPNTKPQTTTIADLEAKEAIAREKMHVNYAFFPGATNDNIEELRKLDTTKIPGIKLFMGSSTGNMLVDKEQALDAIFSLAKEMNLPIMSHCEDTETINAAMERYKNELHSDDPDVTYHPAIRSEEACYKSSSLAQQLARKHGTKLHIAHISTKSELPLLGDNITGEATVAHLLFSSNDYKTLGTRIKCNPSIKGIENTMALREAISHTNDRLQGICTIGTDHAPHAIEEKQGGCAKAMSGMPMIQFSLTAMLSLVDEGVLTLEQLTWLMCHNPAKLFDIHKRGFLRKGYKADIVIVRRNDTPWTVNTECIQSKCKWSPLEGKQMHWQVQQTIINGHLIYNIGHFDNSVKGEAITFRGEED